MTVSAEAGTIRSSASHAAPALGEIGRLAAPLTAFFAIQSATSLVNTAMIGRLGNAALAGVGGASVIYGVVLALMFGADTAVQATISRRTGAGRADLQGQALVDTLSLTAPMGLVLAAWLWWFAPGLVRAMLSDTAAAQVGEMWIRAAAPSLVFLALTIPVNACWIGSGRPATSFAVTALLAPVQIAATGLFLFGAGPVGAWGAAGAGAALSVASLAGVFVQLALVVRPGALPGLRKAWPSVRGAGAIASIGWPISLQQALLQLGLMISFVIVARIGVATAAAANVLVTLTMLPVQLAVGLGVAAATLVGQSLGRGDAEAARRWGWRTSLVGLAATAPFTVVAVVAARPLLSLFLDDPATLALAVWPTRLVGLGLIAGMLCQVLSFALRGAGATRTGALIPFAAQWLGRIPLMLWIAAGLGYGLLGMAGVETGVSLVEAVVIALVWAGPTWTTHRILSKAPPPAAE
jgi:putative MATE family efflux protein